MTQYASRIDDWVGPWTKRAPLFPSSAPLLMAEPLQPSQDPAVEPNPKPVVELKTDPRSWFQVDTNVIAFVGMIFIIMLVLYTLYSHRSIYKQIHASEERMNQQLYYYSYYIQNMCSQLRPYQPQF